MKRSAALALLLLAACSGAQPTKQPPRQQTPQTDLESAAIQAGVIADPANTNITGLYARDTDRVCIVPTATSYRIGVFVDYGDNQHCSGSGSVTRVGETLHVDLDGTEGCSFDARFDGDRIAFPGRLPEACAKVCGGRASMAALDVDQLSQSVSEASTLRDHRGKLLCANGG